MATIRELIDMLEDIVNEVGDEAEVRLVTQPSWPFEHQLLGVTTGAQINSSDEREDDDDVESDNIVYLVEGTQLCYGSKRAWEVVTKI